MSDQDKKVMNQCDGCRAGYPVRDGIHWVAYPSGPIYCTKDRYETPELVFLGRDANGKRRYE